MTFGKFLTKLIVHHQFDTDIVGLSLAKTSPAVTNYNLSFTGACVMRIKSLLLSLSAVAALSAGFAHAATNLVQNGSFTTVNGATNSQISAHSQSVPDITVANWTSSDGNNGGWNFILASANATNNHAMSLASFTASSDGGNFIASDPVYHPGTISQTINGLTANTTYTLTFQYALAQQAHWSGSNTDAYWQVGLGGSSQNSSSLSIAQGGFSGWQTASMTFTATSATEVLSFLAKGGTTGAPPFMLLDGVSLVSAVPEPSTWGMMLGGLGLLGFMARRRAAKQA